MISLSTHLNSLSHGRGSHWRDHDFLERHRIARMHSTVENIEERDWHYVGCFQGTGLRSQELIQGDALSRVSHSFIDFQFFP